MKETHEKGRWVNETYKQGGYKTYEQHSKLGQTGRHTNRGMYRSGIHLKCATDKLFMDFPFSAHIFSSQMENTLGTNLFGEDLDPQELLFVQ